MSEQVVDDVVIGSGPTGWAACMGIWARGGNPLIIDIGYTATNYSADSVIRNAMVKPKSRFGSEHMYAYPLKNFGISLPDGVIPLSGALGGLSTVWGAGIQPVSQRDLTGVPASIAQDWLNSSADLLQKMDFLGRTDLLSRRDPWPHEPHDQVVTSSRFKKVLIRADLKKSVGAQEVLYGSPRLAITGSRNKHLDNACTLCGKCMSGCPEDSIFDSGLKIQNGLARYGGKYLNGIVTELSEDITYGDSSKLNAVIKVQVSDGSIAIFKTKRLYLAAGAIGTPVLLQKSGYAPEILDVRDSQMFYSAFFSIDRFNGTETSMSTSQGYFSTSSEVNQKDEFSLSVYEYSNEFRNRLEQLLPKMIKSAIGLVVPLTQRIVPGIGFLAQDVSGLLRLKWDGVKTSVTLVQGTGTKSAIRTARKRLRKTSVKIGLLPLPNPFKNPSVGAGFHAGSSMPMGESSQYLVDWTGRLKTFPAIRIVDTTCLPRIKAGSHTFMAMANAYRIARVDA
jgi:ferredoxin